MSDQLSKESLEYQARAREVAEKFIRPVAAEHDRTGEYAWEVVEALKKSLFA